MAVAPPTSADRERMVKREIAARGITDPAVLDAMRTVPREAFLPAELAEFAYTDAPLPIAEGQTISQPYIVAAMAEAAELTAGSRVLEIGAGSGYGATVLGEIAGEVWSIERHETLAAEAERRTNELGYDNVHILCGDGTLGHPEAAPFDAIVVTAAGPRVPQALLEQLADGGRLVIPVGPETRSQRLLRVRRNGEDFEEEDLGAVRFVPLIGNQGFTPVEGDAPQVLRSPSRAGGLASLIRESSESLESVESVDLAPLLERIGDSELVLLGEATHGTSEFYAMRDRITRELIVHKGFTAVAIEADWPDAARVDAYVRDRPPPGPCFEPFSRFPTWMWRNEEVRTFVDWLRHHNDTVEDPERQVAFHGLDLYSLYRSRDAVLSHLDHVDPEAAAVARDRYGCLTPWEHDPASYGRAVTGGRLASCESAVVATLTDMLQRRLEYASALGDDFPDALQNATIVANAERYYRVMYLGGSEAWNLRDQHMFDTLQMVQRGRAAATKVVVWEHNSHVGDASATEMGARGELNVGLLARREYGDDPYLVGFGTHDGRVAAASDWGGTMERKIVRPSHPESYERLCHDTDRPAFLLPLRHAARPELREELMEPRLERAIGVIYRPEHELQSHYFQASLPRQFDEFIWFDRTDAVHPLGGHRARGMPDTYPFGL